MTEYINKQSDSAFGDLDLGDSNFNDPDTSTPLKNLQETARMDMQAQMSKLGYNDLNTYINNMGFVGH